jgi:hypothetical protein
MNFRKWCFQRALKRSAFRFNLRLIEDGQYHVKGISLFLTIIGKITIFGPWPSLEDSARFHPVFTSLVFAVVFNAARSSALRPTPSLEAQVYCYRV